LLVQERDTILAALSIAIALAGLLLIFSGFLFSNASSFETARGDKFRLLAKLTLVLVVVSLALTWIRLIAVEGNPWPILYPSLFDIVDVPEEKIAEATCLLFELPNLKAEPAGALGLAALFSEFQLFRDRSVCGIVSGANVCPALYQKVLGSG
jgi:hypothetical protein